MNEKMKSISYFREMEDFEGQKANLNGDMRQRRTRKIFSSPGDANFLYKLEYVSSNRCIALTKSFILNLISIVPAGSNTPPL